MHKHSFNQSQDGQFSKLQSVHNTQAQKVLEPKERINNWLLNRLTHKCKRKRSVYERVYTAVALQPGPQAKGRKSLTRKRKLTARPKCIDNLAQDPKRLKLYKASVPTFVKRNPTNCSAPRGSRTVRDTCRNPAEVDCPAYYTEGLETATL